MGRIACMLVLFLAATLAEAASRKECKASKCAPQIGVCRAACPAAPKRLKRTCRKKCKKEVTKDCRADQVTCGDGGGGGGQCNAYVPTCATRTLEPLRERNFVCTGVSGAGQPCDLDFDTKFRVRSPWKTHEGECCVIDTCRGATAFGVYDNLALPGVVPPGSSLTTAPVIVSVQSLSSYFQKLPTGTGAPGQWQHHTGTILTLLCATPPLAMVVSTAGGPIVAVDRGDFLSYDTRPVPPPTGSWDFLGFPAGGTSLSFAPTRPPLLPECGSTPDTLTCQPPIFKLESVNFPGDRNPVTEVLSERISIDALCDDAIFASAHGTFRRLDGAECAVTIYGRAKIGCTADADCTAGEVCTTTDPMSPVDFGNAFPGYTGQSCVIPTP